MVKFTYPELKLIKQMALERKKQHLKLLSKNFNNPESALPKLPSREDEAYTWKLDNMGVSTNEINAVEVIIRRIEDLDNSIIEGTKMSKINKYEEGARTK